MNVSSARMNSVERNITRFFAVAHPDLLHHVASNDLRHFTKVMMETFMNGTRILERYYDMAIRGYSNDKENIERHLVKGSITFMKLIPKIDFMFFANDGELQNFCINVIMRSTNNLSQP